MKNPFLQRALMTAAAIGCFVLCATVLKGSAYEMMLAGLGGQLIGWAHFNKPEGEAAKEDPKPEEKP